MDQVKAAEDSSKELVRLGWCLSRDKHASLGNAAKQNVGIAEYLCKTVGDAMKARPNTTAEVKVDSGTACQLVVIAAMLDVSAKRNGFTDEKNPIVGSTDMLPPGDEKNVWEWAVGVARAFDEWDLLKESSPPDEFESLSYDGEAADPNIVAILIRVIVESAARLFISKFKAQLDCEPSKVKKNLIIKSVAFNEALRSLNVGMRPVADEFFTTIFLAASQLFLIRKVWGQEAAKKEKEAAKAEKEAAKKAAPKKKGAKK